MPTITTECPWRVIGKDERVIARYACFDDAVLVAEKHYPNGCVHINNMDTGEDFYRHERKIVDYVA